MNVLVAGRSVLLPRASLRVCAAVPEEHLATSHKEVAICETPGKDKQQYPAGPKRQLFVGSKYRAFQQNRVVQTSLFLPVLF